jgi:hypothetical protein
MGSGRRLGRLVNLASQVLNGVDRFEDALDDLAGASLLRLVGETAFEQLGVGEDDPELIVQPVKETRPLRLGQVHNTPSATSAARSSSARTKPLAPGLAIVRAGFTPKRIGEDPY